MAVPTGGTPNGVSDTPLGSFPASGSTFSILTTGDGTDVPNTATFASSHSSGPRSEARSTPPSSVDLSVPVGANCLSFDFKFLSVEYPGFVDTEFNDAFIAELDASTWTTSGSTIVAPNNSRSTLRARWWASTRPGWGA